jgi:hypothetical protein
MATLSALFDSTPENSLMPIERRLTASWNALTKINAYEQVCFSSFLSFSLFTGLSEK